MARKLDDLKSFVESFKIDDIPKSKITDKELNMKIAQVFGISPYVKKTIKENLVEYGFIRILENGIWEIIKESKEEAKEIENKFGV